MTMSGVQRNRNKLPAWLALIAAHCCLGSGFAQPIVVHLRNGDRLTGYLVTEEAGQIIITNAVLGRLALPLAQVERREWRTNQIAAVHSPASPTNMVPPAESLLPPLAQGRLKELQASYLAGQLSAEEYHRQRAKLMEENAALGSVTGRAGVPAPKQAAAAQTSVAPKSPPVKPVPSHWSGELFMGTDLAFSAKDRELYSGRLKLNYVKMPLRNNLDYLFTYGRTDGDLSANRMDGLMKTDYDLNPRFYLYSLGGAGYDEIRKIDWRYELGPGPGYQLFKLTNFVVRVETGFHYQVQNFEGGRQDENIYHRLAQELKWNLGTLFSFDEKAEYSPEVGDFEVYRLRVEANARYWLNSHLSLNFTVINLYDTVTAPGVGQNDLQLRSSIGLKF